MPRMATQVFGWKLSNFADMNQKQATTCTQNKAKVNDCSMRAVLLLIFSFLNILFILGENFAIFITFTMRTTFISLYSRGKRAILANLFVPF